MRPLERRNSKFLKLKYLWVLISGNAIICDAISFSDEIIYFSLDTFWFLTYLYLWHLFDFLNIFISPNFNHKLEVRQNLLMLAKRFGKTFWQYFLSLTKYLEIWKNCWQKNLFLRRYSIFHKKLDLWKHFLLFKDSIFDKLLLVGFFKCLVREIRTNFVAKFIKL